MSALEWRGLLLYGRLSVGYGHRSVARRTFKCRTTLLAVDSYCSAKDVPEETMVLFTNEDMVAALLKNPE